MKKIRIAVASTDGIRVNEHFGRADRFLIYDMDEQITWLEDRPTDPLSTGDPDHPFDAVRFDRISGLLKDCAKVYVTRIGATPVEKLAAAGIEAVIHDGLIADIQK